MDLQLNGRTALVTGASMGIGRAIVLGLAAEGVRVAVAARRRELLERLAGEIKSAGGHPPAIIVEDVTAASAPVRIRDAAVRALGKIEILVNSAGGSRPLPVDAPDEQWDEALMLNFTRLRQLTHAVLPGMIERHHGVIVNVSSDSGRAPSPPATTGAVSPAILRWRRSEQAGWRRWCGCGCRMA